jgi:oxygen-independent coproporphyrinogen-3 oxidase
MSGALPDGEPVPADGRLPDGALASVGAGGFGVYLHVPFCASRCGYCDFNTYTAGDGVDGDGYVEAVLGELELARRVLDGASPPGVATVFVGGGTPTLLPVADLAAMLERIDTVWGIAGDA